MNPIARLIIRPKNSYSPPTVPPTDHSRTHHAPKPYSRCVRDNPRNLKAESPSKNCVSGSAPVAASRLNHPLEAIAVEC